MPLQLYNWAPVASGRVPGLVINMLGVESRGEGVSHEEGRQAGREGQHRSVSVLAGPPLKFH